MRDRMCCGRLLTICGHSHLGKESQSLGAWPYRLVPRWYGKFEHGWLHLPFMVIGIPENSRDDVQGQVSAM